MTNYKIICEDSLNWLNKQEDNTISNIITGMPDYEEVKETYKKTEEYIDFLKTILRLCFKKTKKNGYCIFVQTDRKKNREWIDKSYIVSDIACREYGWKMVFHKIVLNRHAEKIDLFRPSFSHILAYTKLNTTGKQFADVFGYTPKAKIYGNGMPHKVAEQLVKFVKKYGCKSNDHNNNNHADVVDIFCGQSTVGIYCIKEDLSYCGIDIDPHQCKLSEKHLRHLQT